MEKEANSKMEKEANSKMEKEANSKMEKEANSKMEKEANSKMEKEANSKVEKEANSKVEKEANSKVEKEANSKVEDESNILKFARLSRKAYPPVKASKHAVGFDLKSPYEYILPARGKILVKTDLQIKVPDSTYGRIASRSGLAWKHHLDVGAGVIDPDYRGNVIVVLFNHSDVDFKIQPGDRIAQLICEKVILPKVKEVKSLNETERGEDGFGSTGY